MKCLIKIIDIHVRGVSWSSPSYSSHTNLDVLVIVRSHSKYGTTTSAWSKLCLYHGRLCALMILLRQRYSSPLISELQKVGKKARGMLITVIAWSHQPLIHFCAAGAILIFDGPLWKHDLGKIPFYWTRSATRPAIRPESESEQFIPSKSATSTGQICYAKSVYWRPAQAANSRQPITINRLAQWMNSYTYITETSYLHPYVKTPVDIRG